MTKSKTEKVVILIVAAVVLVALVLIPLGSFIYYKVTLPPVDRVEYVRIESDDVSVPCGLNAEELQSYAEDVKEDLVVTAVYGSGNEIIVANKSYNVAFSPMPGEGEVTTANMAYNMDVTLDVAYEAKGSMTVFADNFVEAEDGEIAGGKAQTEGGVGMAGAFDHLTTNPDDNYVKVDVYVSSEVTVKLVARVANGNLHGTTSGGQAWMEDLSLAEVCRLYLNDAETGIAQTAIAPGTEKVDSSSWASLFTRFSDVVLGEYNLNAGKNTIKLSIIDSGNSAYDNVWGSPAGMNIDAIGVIPIARHDNATPVRLGMMGASSEYEVPTSAPLSAIKDEILGSASVIAAIYEDGNYVSVDSADITCSANPEFAIDAAPVGSFDVIMKYKDTSATMTVPVTTNGKITAENGYGMTAVGGSIRTENGKTFAGGFNTNNMSENSVTFTVNTLSAYTADLVLSVSNGYLVSREEGGKTYYRMEELPLGDIANITVNGKSLDLTDISLPASVSENEDFVSLYGNFVNITISGVSLDEGENTIVIDMHRSESGLMTCWSNSNKDNDTGDNLPNESPVINVQSLEVVIK